MAVGIAQSPRWLPSPPQPCVLPGGPAPRSPRPYPLRRLGNKAHCFCPLDACASPRAARGRCACAVPRRPGLGGPRRAGRTSRPGRVLGHPPPPPPPDLQLARPRIACSS
ncbi:polyadenylate-binding protein-interacting protein 2 isoform X2 [Ochotona princeps]|uniref:polyadenylate-binding protein-interacting protein 2 isoform X2 n=1 Tax=Ochotona princeps TaxID=9978 RepID=UPI0027147066|nr:polyadenylate-binding protein-interacting protein 2 isoform X2 [Ochotona princeps]